MGDRIALAPRALTHEEPQLHVQPGAARAGCQHSRDEAEQEEEEVQKSGVPMTGEIRRRCSSW